MRSVMGRVLAIAAMGFACAAAGDARAEGPKGGAPAASAQAGGATSAADLDRVLAPLGEGDADARRAAAKAASALGEEATAAIGEKLAELRRTSGAGERAALHAAKDRAGSRDADLVDALLALSPARHEGVDAAGVRAALVEACLLRSLAHIGTTPAARLLVLAVPDAGGELRPELTRLVKQLGERAVPALIEARLLPSQEAKGWAANMLDALGKHLPSDSVQTKDERVLDDVLRAYGAVRDLDALPVILNFANAERRDLRDAARDAILAYGNDAVWKLREQYQAVTGEQAAEGEPAADLAKQLFAAFDKVRLQEVYALLDEGLARARAGDAAAAVADFDRVLARQPELDRRAEMAPGYLEYARSIDDRDAENALAYARRALALGPSEAEAAQVESEIAYLEGEQLLARGIADPDPFRRAVALDATNARAAAELAKLEARSDERQTKLERGIAIGAALALAVAAAILFAGRRRPPRRTRPA